MPDAPEGHIYTKPEGRVAALRLETVEKVALLLFRESFAAFCASVVR